VTGWLGRLFGPSRAVREELAESEERRDDAKRAREEVAQAMTPVRRALAVNGFEKAVLATFERRHQQ
jgi:hypothetical protein